MSGPYGNRSGLKIVGAAAASLACLPIVTAAALRMKYGSTFFGDLNAIRRQIALRAALTEMRKKNVKLIDFFDSHAREIPEKAFVLYKDEVHTYGGMDEESNKFAQFALRSGALDSKAAVAIFMFNEPNFVLSWLAFNKLGLKTALLNYNLRGDVLLHCIKTCKVKVIACGTDSRLIEALQAIMPELDALAVKVWVLGTNLNQELPSGMVYVDTSSECSDPIPRSVRDDVPNDDDALYMFTSGTTGLPKAARIPYYRQLRGSFIQAALELREDDIIYAPLPLYHSSACVLGFFNVVRVGGTIVLSNFSARRFWDDVRRYRVTVILYIGEICRYLLAQPKREDDGKYSHTIRYLVGNGLSADIWGEFKRRFNLPHIAEFYSATEGTYITINQDGKEGTVGRYHGIQKALMDVIVIVKFDLQTTQPLRGVDGHCLIAPSGEAGLMLLRITESMAFEGYLASKETNEKKLVRNVKKNGDVFFNTGDLMMIDKNGYVYFKDRLGDTFRWKGENIATTEVAHVVNLHPSVQEANVYGVQIPGHDGRAGMASMVLRKDQQLDLKSFYDHVTKSLPLYACPKFLRILKVMDITGTYKHKKTDLVKEGFDLNVISDPLYFMDTETKSYVPLDRDVMRKVVVGQARL